MTARAPMQLRHTTPSAARSRQHAAFDVPESFVMTLGGVALWLALVVGLQVASHRAFGMTVLDAWAFSIAILSYVVLFAGFVAGLVYMVNRESASESGPVKN